jgi:hypothetical protein
MATVLPGSKGGLCQAGGGVFVTGQVSSGHGGRCPTARDALASGCS